MGSVVTFVFGLRKRPSITARIRIVIIDERFNRKLKFAGLINDRDINGFEGIPRQTTDRNNFDRCTTRVSAKIMFQIQI